MIFMHKCLMLSVLYFLKLGFMHHLRIIQTVLIYILFILDFLSFRKLRKSFRMLCLKSFAYSFILGILCFFCSRTALNHFFIIIIFIVGGKICLCIRNQPGDLVLILILNLLCLFKLFLILADYLLLLLFCIIFILLCQCYMCFQRLNPVGTIYTQGIYLLLYFTDIFVYRC